MFPRDIVCRRNISINTLHKGDDDDDDDDNNNNNTKTDIRLCQIQYIFNSFLDVLQTQRDVLYQDYSFRYELLN